MCSISLLYSNTLYYYTVPYYTVLYCTVLYCTILYYTVLYCTVLYCTILYYTVLYCTILYYTVLCYTVYTIINYTMLSCHKCPFLLLHYVFNEKLFYDFMTLKQGSLYFSMIFMTLELPVTHLRIIWLEMSFNMNCYYGKFCYCFAIQANVS